MTPSKRALSLTVVALIAAGSVYASFYAGFRIGRRFEQNYECCQIPRWRNLALSTKEWLGLVIFPSQIGQDKWVLETVFPGVTDGYFLDVGSGWGTLGSNSKALEEKGWTGICIDPFPQQMEGRTCTMLKEVVFSEAGKKMTFNTAVEIGGLTDTLGVWKPIAEKAPAVEVTTTTLRDILERVKAPRFIHFMSLDIEGAELEALKGFPFETHRIGAIALEHNYEEPKRSEIKALLESHGYHRVHTWLHDDFYIPNEDTKASR